MMKQFSFLFLASFFFACAEPLPESPAPDFKDFGTEMYGLLHDEFLWSGKPSEGLNRATAFEAHQSEVITAFNNLAFGKVEKDMLPFLEKILPLYEPPSYSSNQDEGPIPQISQDVAGILKDLTNSRPTLEALHYLATAPSLHPSSLMHLVSALSLHPLVFFDDSIAMLLKLEPEIKDLSLYLSHKLINMEEEVLSLSDPPFFLSELWQETLSQTGEDLGPETFSLRLDRRGLPRVTKNSEGKFPSPFVDQDADGLPDINSERKFIDQDQEPIDIPTFSHKESEGITRDMFGRAIHGSSYVYEYYNVRESLFAFLLRDLRQVVETKSHHHLAPILKVLSGEKKTFQDSDGAYTGFDTSESPLLDLAYAGSEILRYPRLRELILVLKQFQLERPEVFDGLLLDLAKIRQLAKDSPSMAEGNALLDDLLKPLTELVNKGGIRAFLKVASHPDTQLLLPALVKLMKHTDMAFPNSLDELQLESEVNALEFSKLTHYDIPDTEDHERSWFQKITYLMADTWKAPMNLMLLDSYEFHDIVITPDMADFYVHSMAGEAVLDLTPAFLNQAAVQMISEFDDVVLQSEQLNLFLVHNQTQTGNAYGNRGVEIRLLYGPALLAFQASQALKAMKPWAKELVSLELSQAFIELFQVLANHYSEESFDLPGLHSEGSGLRRLEPLLVSAIENTKIGEHFIRFAIWADQAALRDGADVLRVGTELNAFLVWLLEEGTNLRTRKGNTYILDARSKTQNPTRLTLLVDAFRKIDAAIDSDAKAQEAFDALDLLSPFLSLNESGNALKNQHLSPLLSKLLPLLADQLAERISDGQWLEDLNTFNLDLASFMKDRGYSALLSMLLHMDSDPDDQALLDSLLLSLLEEKPASLDSDLFGRSLQALAGLSQARLSMDVLARFSHFLGPLLNPRKELLIPSLRTLQSLRQRDETGVTTSLAENALHETAYALTPLSTLMEAFKGPLRPNPLEETALSQADLKAILGSVSDWLLDKDKGLERLYNIIRNRN